MSAVERFVGTLSSLGHAVTSALVASYEGDPSEFVRVEVVTPDGTATLVEYAYRSRGGDDLFLRDVDDPARQASRESLRRSTVDRMVANALASDLEAPPVPNADYARIVTAVRAIGGGARRVAMNATEPWSGPVPLVDRRTAAHSALDLHGVDSREFAVAVGFVEDLASGAPLEWALRHHGLV